MNVSPPTDKAFARLGTSLTVTLILSLLVVLAGATVRATGSGMGCPDWPLCYGCWVPPVSPAQLPPDFAQRYAVDGHPAEFDAVKTWIEYINRLLGAVDGAALLVTLALTVPVARRRPLLGLLGLVSVVVLAFVAWLGARVVGTFLAPYAVTLHLLSSYALLGLLLAQKEVVARAVTGPRAPANRTQALLLGLVGLAFVLQWTLGIRTREEVEAFLGHSNLASGLWNALGGAYDLHKLTAVLVCLTVAAWAAFSFARRRTARQPLVLALLTATLVLVQALVGLVLWFAGDPAWAKPLHLLAATGAAMAWFAAVLYSLPSGDRSHV